jgi:hypothetical protein
MPTSPNWYFEVRFIYSTFYLANTREGNGFIYLFIYSSNVVVFV